MLLWMNDVISEAHPKALSRSGSAARALVHASRLISGGKRVTGRQTDGLGGKWSFGRTDEEQIQLNEDTYWSGRGRTPQ